MITLKALFVNEVDKIIQITIEEENKNWYNKR
jgi:hypothetical protein